MKAIDLANLSTGVPKIDYSLGVKEALKAFEEYGIYDFLVVVKENKPIGIVKRSDLIKAQQREYLKVGDLAHPLMKLRVATVSSEELSYLLNFFNFERNPLLLVDKKGSYVGVLFYHVVFHYISLFKETAIPLFQKLTSLFGQDYYFYCFYIRDLAAFREKFGSPSAESLQRLLHESIKASIKGDVSLSYEEREIYVLSKERLKEEDIKELYQEFHKEFSLLYTQSEPMYLSGYCIPLNSISTSEEFFQMSTELKRRLEKVHDASFFIFYGEPLSVVLCEYERKEIIYKIKEKIKEDFESILEALKKSERDLWEFTLYDLFKEYPYFELFYIMGESGLQISNNVINPRINYPIKMGKKGADRSEKDYFKKASHEDVYISNIYISQATNDFCITVSKKFFYGGKSYTLAGDINYREIHRLVKEYAKEGKANR
ncbi:MAG: CBS domain-containing protein [Aquificaceae bacterium]